MIYRRSFYIWVWMLLLCIGGAMAQSYRSLWSELQSLEKKGLPQSAKVIAQQIVEKAEREHQAGQLLKAVIWREHYQQVLTPDSLFPAIARMEQWVKQEKDTANQAMLHTLLATYYIHYQQQNRYELRQRSEMLFDAENSNLRTWSDDQLTRTILRHLSASLRYPSVLMRSKGSQYQPLVVLRNGSRPYGHDLYHLLARRAIDYYTHHGDSLVQKANQLYQEMYQRYQQAGHSEGALMALIESCRLDSERSALTNSLVQLDSLIQVYQEYALCAELYLLKAEQLRKQGDANGLTVIQCCDQAIRRYPNYERIGALKNLKEEVMAPSLSVKMPQLLYPSDSLRISFNYKCLSQCQIRIFEAKSDIYPQTRSIQTDEWDRLRGKLRWNMTLQLPLQPHHGATDEALSLMNHTMDGCYQPMLNEGVYLVEVLPLPTKAKIESPCRMLLAVSRLQLVTLDLPDGSKELIVVDAKSGHPVEGAAVDCYNYKNGHDVVTNHLRSDQEGRCLVKREHNVNYCRVAKQGDCALPPVYLYGRSFVSTNGEVKEVTKLLTDRAIYRPGQVLYLKGIVYQQYPDSAHVVVGKQMEVMLLDVNRKEVARQKVCSNDYGSFTVIFKIPARGLNGPYQVKSSTGESCYIQVEEYKRPSFEIQVDDPEVAYQWGDTLTLTGVVKGYQGAPLQNATIACTPSYRQAIYRWHQEKKPLRQDTVYSDREGRFAYKLYLKAIERVATLHVAFTIVSEYGETQEVHYDLPVSTHPFQLGAEIPALVCKEDSLSFLFYSHNGVGRPLPTKGSYHLYLMKGETTDYSNPVMQGELCFNQPATISSWRLLPSGRYRMVMHAEEATHRQMSDSLITFTLFSKSDRRVPADEELFSYVEKSSFDEIHPAVIYWGTSCQEVYLYEDYLGEKQRVSQRLVQMSDTLMRCEIPYRQAYGEEVQLMLSFVKEGKLYSQSFKLTKQTERKPLQLKWRVMRDRLMPGADERWEIAIQKDGKGCQAELMALLYDASLDRLALHNPTFAPYYFRYFPAYYKSAMPNYRATRGEMVSFAQKYHQIPAWAFDEVAWPSASSYGRRMGHMMPVMVKAAASAPQIMLDSQMANKERIETSVATEEDAVEEKQLLPDESVRMQFNETAFFYPQLRTDSAGVVFLQFVAPESLTRWNFIGFAHTQQMQTGTLRSEVITSKEFMVQPAWPRFLREGDVVNLQATVTNLTAKRQKGRVKLTLFDPYTEKVIEAKNASFDLNDKASQVVTFQLKMDGQRSLMGFRLVADGGSFSDGEQQVIPILSRSFYLTETLPFLMRTEGDYQVSLDTLFNAHSPMAKERTLTVEVTGHAAWSALMALPALENPTSDNTMAWTSAIYAHSLARYIANRYPQLRAYLSALEVTSREDKADLVGRLTQQEGLRDFLLSETPWVMRAEEESKRLQRLVRYFDANQSDYQQQMAVAKLKQLQLADGSWGWYAGMQPSLFTTTFVIQQLVRLKALTGQPLPPDLLQICSKGMDYLQKEAMRRYQDRLKRQRKGDDPICLSADLDYLYLLAMDGAQKMDNSAPMVNALIQLWEKHRHQLPINQKIRLAVVLLKNNHRESAMELVRSVKEHLTTTAQRGAHFAFKESESSVNMQPLSLHVAAMEMFQMAGGEDALLEEMKVWLLLQKQAQQWAHAVASVDAVYALLLRGENLLRHSGKLSLSLGNVHWSNGLNPLSDGICYLKRTFIEGEKALNAHQLKVEKGADGLAWGAVYAHSLVPMDEVKSYGQGLQVEKQLYVERRDNQGKASLEPVHIGHTLIQKGDKVVTRLVICCDRSFDFVQLKDLRGACLEPLSLHSGYRWRSALSYYQEVKDAATNFNFDHLPKGVHVVEYACRVVRSGLFEAGVAVVQSAYAPEYAGHSASVTLEVKE